MRVTIDRELLEDIDQAKIDLGLPSRRDLIRRAIRFYLLMESLRKSDGQLQVRHKNGSVTQVVFV